MLDYWRLSISFHWCTHRSCQGQVILWGSSGCCKLQISHMSHTWKAGSPCVALNISQGLDVSWWILDTCQKIICLAVWYTLPLMAKDSSTKVSSQDDPNLLKLFQEEPVWYGHPILCVSTNGVNHFELQPHEYGLKVRIYVSAFILNLSLGYAQFLLVKSTFSRKTPHLWPWTITQYMRMK